MKTFKLIDCWISTILITGSFIYGFTSQSFHFINGYFIVGGWQLISIVTHYLIETFIGRARNNYSKLLALIVTSLVGFYIVAQVWEPLFGVFMIELFVLLIIAPLMAVGYTIMCFEETYLKMKRPLALLK